MIKTETLRKNFLQFKENLTFSKRQQFVLVTMLLTSGLALTQIFTGGLRFDLLAVLVVSAYILSAIVLKEGLSGWDFLTLLILPTYFTGAVYAFYFLLPIRWLTRLPTLIIYALGMYAILLSENIFNVSSERNIQLYRVAHVGGFLFSIISVFLLFNTLLTHRLNFWTNGILTLFIIFPLVLQALWSMELTQYISLPVWLSTGVVSLVILELVVVFSFWPIHPTVEAIFISTTFYSLVGMLQQFLIQRLFAKTVKEYLIWLAIATLILLVSVVGQLSGGWGNGIR